jgi:hypothetical protein
MEFDPKAILVFLALCVPFFIGTIWAVTDVAQKDFGATRDKVLWWIVASIPFLGFLIYLALGFRRGRKTP